jgi:hypothetical protein
MKVKNMAIYSICADVNDIIEEIIEDGFDDTEESE